MTFHDKDAIQASKQASAVVSIKALLTASQVSDVESLTSAIESETSFKEVMEKLLLREREAAAMEKKNKEMEAEFKAKAKRFKDEQEYLRGVMLAAMQQAGETTLRTAFGTITDKADGPKLVIEDGAEEFIPTKFFKPGDPKLVKSDVSAYVEQRNALLAEAQALPDGSERAAALEAANVLKGKAKKEAIAAAELLPSGEEWAVLMLRIETDYPAIPGVYMETGGRTLSIRK